MIAGWIISGLLYLLGGFLMIDNIRAQPHEAQAKPGYGFILLGMVIVWPLTVVYGALAVLWDRA